MRIAYPQDIDTNRADDNPTSETTPADFVSCYEVRLYELESDNEETPGLETVASPVSNERLLREEIIEYPKNQVFFDEVPVGKKYLVIQGCPN
ncbi:MAG: hypothetical protein ACLFQV_04055 [Vulcanimicrobiota bacterium]